MVKKCANPECNNEFVRSSNRKKYCERKCMYRVSYLKRKEQISRAAKLYILAHSDATKEYQKRYRDEHKEETKTYDRKRVEKKSRMKQTYGITIEDWQAMFEKQEGRCAICGAHQTETTKGLFVDHDHNTGKVRGLLCQLCNVGIGGLKDSTKLLRKAISYLEEAGA